MRSLGDRETVRALPWEVSLYLQRSLTQGRMPSQVGHEAAWGSHTPQPQTCPCAGQGRCRPHPGEGWRPPRLPGHGESRPHPRRPPQGLDQDSCWHPSGCVRRGAGPALAHLDSSDLITELTHPRGGRATGLHCLSQTLVPPDRSETTVSISGSPPRVAGSPQFLKMQ